MNTALTDRTILWWGRYDPDYGRNRLLRRLLQENGYGVTDFRPRSSFFGALEGYLSPPGKPSAVWVPAFRHRDFPAARQFADRHDLPLIFDPLISAWDKAVNERRKFNRTSFRSKRLLNWERSLFSRADLVLADTRQHADFFCSRLGASQAQTVVVPVGADEQIFSPQPWPASQKPLEILFYGSFIDLQAPQVIATAATRLAQFNWSFVGDGPLRRQCESICRGCPHISFEPWLDYIELPARIGRAHILLGVFSHSAKAGRVIPNKVYQALACGRPVISRTSTAYPIAARQAASGLEFVEPASPEALIEAVVRLAQTPLSLADLGAKARRTYETCFSEPAVETGLLTALARLGLASSPKTR